MPAILPSHPSNPVGQTRQINAALKLIRARMKSVRDWLLARLDSIPKRELSVNYRGFVVNSYEYQISIEELQAIVDELARRYTNLPYDQLERLAAEAYEAGTDFAIANLTGQTALYTRTITEVLATAPWQRRVALVRARMFEEMEGFGGESAKRLGRLLQLAVQNGQAPSAAAADIAREFAIERRRAERIARTEITGAFRRARWDEADEAAQTTGMRVKLIHLSAFSPTTRKTHAARDYSVSGATFTTAEVRDWYSVNGNAINCKCTQVEVFVDENGKVVDENLLKRAQRRARSNFAFAA